MHFWSEAYPPANFPTVWKHLDGLITAGRIRSTSEVKPELQRVHPDVLKWTKKKTGIFVPVDVPIQTAVAEILGRFPRLVGMGTRSAADPFVIALAKVHGFTVVTEEHPGSVNRPHIPDVCAHYGIKVMRGLDLIQAEKWSSDSPRARFTRGVLAHADTWVPVDAPVRQARRVERDLVEPPGEHMLAHPIS